MMLLHLKMYQNIKNIILNMILILIQMIKNNIFYFMVNIQVILLFTKNFQFLNIFLLIKNHPKFQINILKTLYSLMLIK